MELELKGKRVLITGGSKGIGRACAEGFAAEGAEVHIASRNEAELAATAAAITQRYGTKVTIHPFDLSKQENALALAAAVSDVDILVNNAGAIPGGGLNEVNDQRWRQGWDLKIFGTINLTRAVYEGMCKRGNGAIVNVIGVAGERHRADYIAGTSGNAALMAFTRALGGQSVDFGIRVVGVNPGRIETERQINHMRERAKKTLGDAERWREVQAQIAETLPFKRAGRPSDVADLVVYLASARASYISGTVVTIDCGQSLRERA